MPSLFESELVAVTTSPPSLPLTHGTNLECLAAIIASTIGGNTGVIEPRFCNEFSRNLIYTFYGRPAYMKAGDEYTTDPAGLPIFLVVNSTLIDQSVMIYPFDTGRYHRYTFSADWTRDDFTLQAIRGSIDRVIHTFYDTERDYYWIDPKDLTLSPGASPLKGYYRMLASPHPRPEDGRESSIEIAFDSPLALAGNLELAIIPAVGAGMADLRPALSALGCTHVSYYSWTKRYKRADFRQLLWQIVADHLGF